MYDVLDPPPLSVTVTDDLTDYTHTHTLLGLSGWSNKTSAGERFLIRN